MQRIFCLFNYYASVSLTVVEEKISVPYEICHSNQKHHNECNPYEDSYFETLDFMTTVKNKIKANPHRTTMQVYEEARSEHRRISNTPMPDFRDVKSGLSKFFDEDDSDVESVARLGVAVVDDLST